MDKPNVIKKERVNAIRRSRKKACYGNANVTSVMAVDSHADNHYDLAIDNVNNNTTKKPFHRHSIKFESREDDYGLNPVDEDSAGDESQKGSARRKCSTVSKGISIEEFLLTPERQNQLSAIDKLLIKNKTALQNLQMKQTKAELKATAGAPATETAATTTNGKPKKEPKRKEKVLGSKIAAKKKPGDVKKKSAPVTKKSSLASLPLEAKISVKKGIPVRITHGNFPKLKTNDAPKRRALFVNELKIASTEKKGENSTPAKVEQTDKIKTVGKRSKESKKSTKKVPPAASPATAVVATGSKKPKKDTNGKKLTKSKKKPVKNVKKLLEGRGFAPSVLHKTRSSTKVVQLRNGKSRITPESKKTAPSPQPRKYSRRSANISLDNSSNDISVNGGKSTPCKRSIKQEPRDEDSGVKRKRRKTEKIETPVTPTVTETDPKPISNEPAPEPTSVQSRMPILVKEETKTPILKPKPTIEEEQIPKPKPTIEEKQCLRPRPTSEEQSIKPNPAIEETPVILEQNALETPPVIDPEPTPSTAMIVDEAPVIKKDQLTVEPIIEEPSEPPMLSPQAPASSASTIEDVIVIDSSEDSDIQVVDSPPVIPPLVPASKPATEAAPTKPEEQLEDTATETSEDTGDEEFALQDANTESEDIIDEDITLQYETDDEDSTDKDIAREPAAATVATVTGLVQQPKEPVESAREKITPVVEEPKVIPSQEKQSKQSDTKVQDRQENTAVKESILGALGLTSLEKVQQKVKESNNYTGTLKAVIKIDKGCRRMELKPKDAGAGGEGLQNENVLSFYSKTLPSKFDQVSESATLDKGVSEIHPVNGLDSAAFKNKCPDDGLLSSIREANVRAMETDYNGITDPVGGLAKEKTKAAASLVVPEKSSSFSIHPNRLCSDVCKYCFGKFGSLDTPCHVGQMKNPERQRKILLCEPNLKLDTCLCDACYRFVDRKANKPPQKRTKNNMRRSISINQRTMGPCVIQNCTQFARHTVKRKWLLRISKKIAKLSFDVNKGGPRMRYGLCSQHYYLVDFYTLCGICKKRLNRNHMYSVRSELNDLNNILLEDSIPIKLVDNMLLCKLCHYYTSLRLKYGDASKMSTSNRQYYQNFRKKILIYYNVAVSDSEDVITSKCLKYENGTGIASHSPDSFSQGSKMIEELAASTSKPPTVTTSTATSSTSTSDSKRPSSSSSSSKKTNHNVGFRDFADLLKPLEGDGDKNSSTRIQVKFGNLNIGKLSNLNIGQNSSTHQSEPKHDKSGDKEVPLIADFCFKTPNDGSKNWEKCVSTILFDKGTKKLWQDLQKPYGNQSSFIRHLIMLEKYWRSGALVLAGNADAGAVKYINSVKNRIQSLETSSSSPSPSPTPSPTPTPPAVTAKPPQLPTLKPTSNVTVENGSSTIHYKPSPAQKTSPDQAGSSSVNVRHTPAPPPLLKIDQMNGIPFAVSNKIPVSVESKVQYQPHPPKRAAPRTAADISLEQYVEMMHPQPRTKVTAQVTNGTVKGMGMSMLKKTLPAMPTMKPIHIANSASAESLATPAAPRIFARKSASMMYQGTANLPKPKDRQFCNMNMPQLTAISTASTAQLTPFSTSVTAPSKSVVDSSFIAKLPKALTVTQIEEPVSKSKVSSDKQHIPAPFLAGEKPSVSVFREITK